MSPVPRASFLLTCVVLGAACSTVETESELGTPLAARDTYAWTDATPARDVEGTITDDEALSQRVTDAVDLALADAGFRRVSADEASMVVGQQLSIAVRTEFNDPYYSFWRAVRFEEGTLLIELRDARTQELLWRGIGRHRVRDVARDLGMVGSRYAPTEEERHWAIDDLVDAVMESLPESE